MSVAVHVNENFRRYKSGIFIDDSCDEVVNHGVIITGCQEGYMKLRNSWGSGWGEQGYMRIARESNNPYGTCNVLQFVSYPDKF